MAVWLQNVKKKLRMQTQPQLILPDACFNLHPEEFVYIFNGLCWHLGKYTCTHITIYIY